LLTNRKGEEEVPHFHDRGLNWVEVGEKRPLLGGRGKETPGEAPCSYKFEASIRARPAGTETAAGGERILSLKRSQKEEKAKVHSLKGKHVPYSIAAGRLPLLSIAAETKKERFLRISERL